jgi:hypothetical protein
MDSIVTANSLHPSKEPNESWEDYVISHFTDFDQLSSMLKNNKAIVVTDGSYKAPYSSASSSTTWTQLFMTVYAAMPEDQEVPLTWTLTEPK